MTNIVLKNHNLYWTGSYWSNMTARAHVFESAAKAHEAQRIYGGRVATSLLSFKAVVRHADGSKARLY